RPGLRHARRNADRRGGGGEPCRLNRRRLSEVHKDEQLDVDAEPFGALLFDEVVDVRPRDEVAVDILMLIAAALADPFDSVRMDKSEALRQHSLRGVEIAQALETVSG